MTEIKTVGSYLLTKKIFVMLKKKVNLNKEQSHFNNFFKRLNALGYSN